MAIHDLRADVQYGDIRRENARRGECFDGAIDDQPFWPEFGSSVPIGSAASALSSTKRIRLGLSWAVGDTVTPWSRTGAAEPGAVEDIRGKVTWKVLPRPSPLLRLISVDHHEEFRQVDRQDPVLACHAWLDRLGRPGGHVAQVDARALQVDFPAVTRETSSRSTAERMGAKGLRGSCPGIARNVSLA